MGFGGSDLRFLLSAKRLGLKGDTVCTLGRQTLFLSQRELTLILREYDCEHFALPKGQALLFADDVLRPLGFNKIDAMDASDYEGADVLHDLNRPVPPEMQEKYDLVWDGGTLDELFFRVFVPENGFELLRIYMCCNGGYYHIADPVTVHGRVELLNSRGAMIMVHAHKVGHVPDVLITPQQSDYLTTWTDHKTEKHDGRLKSLIRARISPASVAKISKVLNNLRQKRSVWRWKTQSKLSNRKFYVPVTTWDVPTSQIFNR